MTQIRQERSKATGFLLALAMILAAALGTAPLHPSPIKRNSDNTMNAAVTIKTMAAANEAIENGASRGIDVSKYQGTIDWSQVASDNVSFAFVRATYGVTNDPYFVTNAQGAHANGIKVGAYHYATFHDSDSVKREAAQFLSQLRQVDITYPVALDIEAAKYTKASRSVVTKLAKQFMDIIAAEGYTVMLYSYNNFIKAHIDQSMIDGYRIWVANYMAAPTGISHSIWQHTSYGTVSGIKGRVDINIAYGSGGSGTVRASNAVRTSAPAATPTPQPVKVSVDNQVSTTIKQTLNERYNTGLPMDSLNMAQMNAAIYTGLQEEINRQFDDATVPVSGALGADEVNLLSSIQFVSGQTGGNITYLLQAKLFYKGAYTGELTGQFDDNTVQAVKAFQQTNGIPANGGIDATTLKMLLA